MRDSNPQPLGLESNALPLRHSLFDGGDITKAFDGIRTRDLSLTKRVLCQLSYEGTKNGESGFRSRCLVVANDALYRLS